MMQLNLSRQDIGLLVREAIAESEGWAAARHIHIELDMSLPDPWIILDPVRFGQVIRNLLSNAVKFSRAGQTVRLSCQVSQGQAVIRVSDQGCGIPEAFHSQVFERFAQADTGNQRRVKGTGLGLAIVRRIAALHGGSVDLRNREGGGLEARVCLPLGLLLPRDAS